MRLQAEGAPDAADARGRDAGVTRHAARAPMRGSARLALQRLHDDALDLRIVDLARHPRPRLVEQPVNAALDKTPTPLANRLHGHPLARRHRLVAQARGTAQYDARPHPDAICLLKLSHEFPAQHTSSSDSSIAAERHVIMSGSAMMRWQYPAH